MRPTLEPCGELRAGHTEITHAATILQNLTHTTSAFQPCIDYPYLPAVMGPCQGPVGGVIRVRLRRDLGSPAVLLSFKSVVSRGVPARLQVRLQGRGLDHQTTAPPQLCIQGGGSWETELVLANGRNLGVIGGYTPTNCPR